MPSTSHRQVYIRPGESGRAEMPYSEVCMHMRVAGRVMDFTLSRQGHLVQLLNPDRTPFSAPILPGEAGIHTDLDGRRWYHRPTARTCAGCGLPIDRAEDGTWFVAGSDTSADGLASCPSNPDHPAPDELGGHVPLYVCDIEARDNPLLPSAAYRLLRQQMDAGDVISDRMARTVASWWQSPGDNHALARLAGTSQCDLTAVRDAVHRELRGIRRRRGDLPAGRELTDLLAWAEHRITSDRDDQ
jgi:hypothetical protein